MTVSKRLFDIALALLAAALLAIPFLAICLLIAARSGRPIFYTSTRMKTPERAFSLWKFRTMTTAQADIGVSGGDKQARITREGHLLRRYRLDEMPQLWNILRGDMSVVGPRPPLAQYVHRFPALYARVLQARPGLTGLATLRFHRHEARLLAACQTPTQTDLIYTNRCLPRKARLDLIYLRHRSLCFDLVLLWQSLRGLLHPP